MEGSGSSKSSTFSSSVPKMTTTSRIPQAGSRLPVASSRFASSSTSTSSISTSSSSLATSSLERFEVKSLNLTSSLGGTSSKSLDGMRPRLQTTRDPVVPPSVAPAASVAVVAPPPAPAAVPASTTPSTTATGRPFPLSRGVSDQRLRDVQSSVASAIESLSTTTPTAPRNATLAATIDKIMTRGSQSGEDNYQAAQVAGSTGSQSLKTRLSLSPHPQYSNNRLGSPYNASRIGSSSLSGRATPLSNEEDLKLLPALSADFQPATLAAEVEAIYNRVFVSGPSSADLLSIWGIGEGLEYQDGLFSDATTAQQLQRRQEEEVERQGGYSMALHSKRALNSEYFRLFDEEYLKNKDYYGPRLFFDLSTT